MTKIVNANYTKLFAEENFFLTQKNNVSDAERVFASSLCLSGRDSVDNWEEVGADYKDEVKARIKDALEAESNN